MSQTVLVTGASGFLAAWVVREFLSHGYTVIGTVRSQSKADQIQKDLPGYGDRLQFRIVPDMSVEGAFDEAVKDVDGVIHTASPFQTHGVVDVEKELLYPAISGATGVLKSIKKNNPNVRRVVLTSSFAAVSTPGKLKSSGSYTEADFNTLTLEEGKQGNAMVAYCASKGLAEKAAWDFIDNEKPNFQLSTICPPLIFGPVAQPLDKLSNLNTSLKDILNLIDGSLQEVPPTMVPFTVDVRDVALAHRLAYENEKAAGQRYITSEGVSATEDISDILRKHFPELRDKIPARDPSKEVGRPPFQLDSSKAERELGLKFIPLEQTVVDSAKSLIELQKVL